MDKALQDILQKLSIELGCIDNAIDAANADEHYKTARVLTEAREKLQACINQIEGLTYHEVASLVDGLNIGGDV